VKGQAKCNYELKCNIGKMLIEHGADPYLKDKVSSSLSIFDITVLLICVLQFGKTPVDCIILPLKEKRTLLRRMHLWKDNNNNNNNNDNNNNNSKQPKRRHTISTSSSTTHLIPIPTASEALISQVK
jgi:hypothetical protein